jgi:perosamine synthetase
LGDQEIDAIRAAVLGRNQSLSWGNEVAEFEKEFATYCGAAYAVAVSSCTAALDLCAQTLRLTSEDEVIATPQTFWATISALVRRRVKIRFADVDRTTLNLDPDTVIPLISERTKAIYVVHYGGNPARLGELAEIAAKHGLVVVEDCAHAPGATYGGRRIGSGDLCCFSFQSYKNMNTLGEGGMITTNHQKYAESLRKLRTTGLLGEFRPRQQQEMGRYRKPATRIMDHSFGSWDFDLTQLHEVGSNYRMSAVAAAVGRIQLGKLDGNNGARERVAALYRKRLATLGFIQPLAVAAEDTPSWHLFTCFLDPASGLDRNELLDHVQRSEAVEIVMRYFPLHLMSVVRAFGHDVGECPTCESTWFERQINLPMSASFTEADVDTVTEALRAAANRCVGVRKPGVSRGVARGA